MLDYPYARDKDAHVQRAEFVHYLCFVGALNRLCDIGSYIGVRIYIG